VRYGHGANKLDTNSDKDPVIKGVTVRAAAGKLVVRVRSTLVAGFLCLNKYIL